MPAVGVPSRVAPPTWMALPYWSPVSGFARMSLTRLSRMVADPPPSTKMPAPKSATPTGPVMVKPASVTLDAPSMSTTASGLTASTGVVMVARPRARSLRPSLPAPTVTCSA